MIQPARCPEAPEMPGVFVSSSSSSSFPDDASIADAPAQSTAAAPPAEPQSRRERRAAETAAIPTAATRSVRFSMPARPAWSVQSITTAVVDARQSIRRVAVVGGVMAITAGLVIGTTIPSSVLLATASTDIVEATAEVAAQTERVGVVADSVDAASVPAPAARDTYVGGSSAALQMASYQSAGLGYAPGYIPTTGSIRWPFPYSTTMSSGYGEWRGDSIHTGLDFNPGSGSPIQSIAAGIVISAGWGPTSALGYYVVVQHDINGQLIESTYAHMIDGSSSLSPGQVIAVGETIGQVGTTGLSTGPHLHLIIKVNGTAVDPYEWLTTNATNK